MDKGRSNLALEVSLRADKPIYKQGEKIKLEASLVNVGKKTLYVFGILRWGHSASLTLNIMDSTGKYIEPNIFDDSLTPPPPPSDKSILTALHPAHYLGTFYESSLAELNINKPGKYTALVEYHSPIESSFAQGLPIWGNEMGAVRSTPIHFEVRFKDQSKNKESRQR
jgi:hypothetical protein